jgi:hypothetical protein
MPRRGQDDRQDDDRASSGRLAFHPVCQYLTRRSDLNVRSVQRERDQEPSVYLLLPFLSLDFFKISRYF